MRSTARSTAKRGSRLAPLTSASAWATASVAAPANCTASIGAMQNFGGYFGGALAPVVTGFIVQRSSSFQPALFVGAGVAAVAVIGYWLLVRGPIPPAALDDNV